MVAAGVARAQLSRLVAAGELARPARGVYALPGQVGNTEDSVLLVARRLPEGRRYGVVAGTGRLLEAIAEFLTGGAPARVVQPPSTKTWDLQVQVPVPDLGELGGTAERALRRARVDIEEKSGQCRAQRVEDGVQRVERGADQVALDQVQSLYTHTVMGDDLALDLVQQFT